MEERQGKENLFLQLSSWVHFTLTSRGGEQRFSQEKWVTAKSKALKFINSSPFGSGPYSILSSHDNALSLLLLKFHSHRVVSLTLWPEKKFFDITGTLEIPDLKCSVHSNRKADTVLPAAWIQFWRTILNPPKLLLKVKLFFTIKPKWVAAWSATGNISWKETIFSFIMLCWLSQNWRMQACSPDNRNIFAFQYHTGIQYSLFVSF